MIIAGWGNNNIIRSDIFYPKNEQEIIEILEKLNNEGIITRGLGRSYGDMSLYKNILSSLISKLADSFSILIPCIALNKN